MVNALFIFLTFLQRLPVLLNPYLHLHYSLSSSNISVPGQIRQVFVALI